MKNHCLSVLFALLFLASIPAKAEQSEPILSFADQLSKDGDYYRAITEYKRFLFLHPEHDLAGSTDYKIALCYYMGGRLETAADMFQSLKASPSSKEVGRSSALMLAQTFYSQRKFWLAAEELRRIEENYHSDECLDAARLMTALCSLRLGNTNAAAASLAKVGDSSAMSAKARSLLAELPDFGETDHRSPWLAGVLSAALPGAGQLYIGRPRDALLSFLLNGALIFAAYSAFENNENVAGCIVAFVETGWYFGNIYNAASSAHKFNRDRKEESFKNLELQYGLSLFNEHGLSLCPSLDLRLRF